MEIMGFKQINEKMNYAHESKQSFLYDTCINFVIANNEILSKEQLDAIQNYILPPSAFDDDKKRSNEDYKTLMSEIEKYKINKLSYENGRGM